MLYKSKHWDNCDIMIDYFDKNGDSLPGDRTITDPYLNPGEIREEVLSKPDNAKSYRIWLIK